ncbi:MAG: HNH endonuclease [Balneolaceae bacterium]
MSDSRPEKNTPEYKAWRSNVFTRDRWTCQKCGEKGNIEAHHIVRWSDSKALRYSIMNGITLCIECHKEVTGNEEFWRDKFRRIVARTVANQKKGSSKSSSGKRKKKKKSKLQPFDIFLSALKFTMHGGKR